MKNKHRTLKQTDGPMITTTLEVMGINNQFRTDYDGFIIHHDGLYESLFGFYGIGADEETLVHKVAESVPHKHVLDM